MARPTEGHTGLLNKILEKIPGTDAKARKKELRGLKEDVVACKQALNGLNAQVDATRRNNEQPIGMVTSGFTDADQLIEALFEKIRDAEKTLESLKAQSQSLEVQMGRKTVLGGPKKTQTTTKNKDQRQRQGKGKKKRYGS